MPHYPLERVDGSLLCEDCILSLRASNIVLNPLGRVDGSLLCEDCILPLCSEECRRGPSHAVECSVYARLRGKASGHCTVYTHFTNKN